jgi:succinate dehydrogenase/fumarate reductase-like Fe-S protein
VPPNAPRRPLTPRQGFFDNAFKNESFDTPAKGGAKAAPKKKTVPVKIGNRTVEALPNQRLKDVVRAARAPIRFNCENGKCGTCESRVDGKLTRICTMAVPARGCTITRK